MQMLINILGVKFMFLLCGINLVFIQFLAVLLYNILGENNIR